MTSSTTPNGKIPWINALSGQVNFLRAHTQTLTALDSPEDAAILRKSYLSKLAEAVHEAASPIIILNFSSFVLSICAQFPMMTDLNDLAHNKSTISALNQARFLSESIVKAASGTLQYPPEYQQLSATTKKTLDIFKSSNTSTTPVVSTAVNVYVSFLSTR